MFFSSQVRRLSEPVRLCVQGKLRVSSFCSLCFVGTSSNFELDLWDQWEQLFFPWNKDCLSFVSHSKTVSHVIQRTVLPCCSPEPVRRPQMFCRVADTKRAKLPDTCELSLASLKGLILYTTSIFVLFCVSSS